MNFKESFRNQEHGWQLKYFIFIFIFFQGFPGIPRWTIIAKGRLLNISLENEALRDIVKEIGKRVKKQKDKEQCSIEIYYEPLSWYMMMR